MKVQHEGSAAVAGRTFINLGVPVQRGRKEAYSSSGQLGYAGLPKTHDASYDEAETVLTQAISCARGQSSKSMELRVVNSLSRLLISRQRSPEANEMLSRIWDWFSEGHDTADHIVAKDLLRLSTEDNSDPLVLPSTL